LQKRVPSVAGCKGVMLEWATQSRWAKTTEIRARFFGLAD